MLQIAEYYGEVAAHLRQRRIVARSRVRELSILIPGLRQGLGKDVAGVPRGLRASAEKNTSVE